MDEREYDLSIEVAGEDVAPGTARTDRGHSLFAYPAIFAIALGLRVIAQIEIAHTPFSEVLLGDSRGYVGWARTIAEGNWLGDDVFYQAPLYPYFLAAVFKTFGPSLDGVRVVQSLLGASACMLVAAATTRFFSARAGIVAGLLLAFYPSAIFFDLIVQKASLASVLISLLLFLIARTDKAASLGWPVLCGIVLGALILTRENALALVPCLLVWLALPWSGGSGTKRAIRCAFFVLGLALVLVPIGARNLAFGDQFLITTSQLGTNLYIGNGTEADGRYRPLVPNRGYVAHERRDAQRLAEEESGRPLSPGEVSNYWTRRTLREIANDPSKWIRLMVHKAHMVLNAEEVPDTESIEAYADESRLLAVLIRFWHFGVLFPLACLGIWTTRKHWRETLPLLLIALAMMTSVVAFYVMSRYRFPVVPVLIAFAGAGVAVPLDRRVARDRGAWIGIGLVLGLSALVSNVPTGVDHQPRAVTHFNVGMVMFKQNRLPEAQHSLELAAKVTDASMVHLRLGEVLARRGEFEKAILHYQSMLIRNLADPVELRRRIRLLRARLASERRPGEKDSP